MLQSTLTSGKSFKVQSSPQINLNELSAFSLSQINQETSKIANILDTLSEQKFKIINKHSTQLGNHMSNYSVNMANLLYAIWMKNIEKLIEKKFNSGRHVRVFRALQVLEIADEGQLEEACLLNLKEIRGVLMDLFKEELIRMYEINGRKGKYAYGVIFGKYVKKLVDLLYKVKLIFFFI